MMDDGHGLTIKSLSPKETDEEHFAVDMSHPSRPSLL